MEKWHLCVRPWSLLTILNFSARGRQTQRHFNISSPSSRRDNKRNVTLDVFRSFAYAITYL